MKNYVVTLHSSNVLLLVAGDVEDLLAAHGADAFGVAASLAVSVAFLDCGLLANHALT